MGKRVELLMYSNDLAELWAFMEATRPSEVIRRASQHCCTLQVFEGLQKMCVAKTLPKQRSPVTLTMKTMERLGNLQKKLAIKNIPETIRYTLAITLEHARFYHKLSIAEKQNFLNAIEEQGPNYPFFSRFSVHLI
ncbi:MAG: hypothetical protein OXR68_03595 [Alphaproteobacteria bacterium]|nr:hypothetical protein [Alphaproteobacteria bacterium]MDD9919690.1 hypothetical protein [Alphaproteobacteria bacterium]